MDQNFTYVALLIDRSGSMQSIQKDMQGGLKTFAEQQRKQAGKIKVSLFDFDTQFQTIGENRDLDVLENYVLVPRGGTALNDAIGRSVARVGELLASMPEEERPAKVMFMIVTDGAENASVEYSGAQVKEIIERQTKQWNWDFIYLGANQDAIGTGASMGISSKKAMNYAAGEQGVNAMFMAAGNYTSNLRSSATMDVASVGFSEEDREEAMKE